jgi:hypothetical protein
VITGGRCAGLVDAKQVAVFLAQQPPREELSAQLVDVVPPADPGDAEILETSRPARHAVVDGPLGDRLVAWSRGAGVLGGFPVADRVAGIGQREELRREQQPFVLGRIPQRRGAGIAVFGVIRGRREVAVEADREQVPARRRADSDLQAGRADRPSGVGVRRGLRWQRVGHAAHDDVERTALAVVTDHPQPSTVLNRADVTGNVEIRTSTHTVVAEPHRSVTTSAEGEWGLARTQHGDLHTLEVNQECARCQRLGHRHTVTPHLVNGGIRGEGCPLAVNGVGALY